MTESGNSWVEVHISYQGTTKLSSSDRWNKIVSLGRLGFLVLREKLMFVETVLAVKE